MGRFSERETVLLFPATMKRKTKIPENVWNVICTAAIIAVLIFAAYAFFK